MLPPIPHSLMPVTAQQDVPKPRPDIPPVTPPSESAKESAIELDRRHPQEAEMLLYEEQRRRQPETNPADRDYVLTSLARKVPGVGVADTASGQLDMVRLRG